MEFWVKVGLFTTGYLPLFFILAFKNWGSTFACALLMAVLVYNCVWLYYVTSPTTAKNPLQNLRKQKCSSYIVDKIDHDDPPISVYIVWYLIPFMNLASGILQVFILVGILIAVFQLYTQSDLVCINPVLNVVGYRLYNIKVREQYQTRSTEVLYLTDRKHIDVNDQIDIDALDSDVYLEA